MTTETRSLPNGVAGSIVLATDLSTLSRPDLERLRDNNLHAMLAAAGASDSVRRRWPALDQVTDVTDLARLPVLAPQDLEAACPPRSAELLFGDGDDDGGLVIRSSGTSGLNKVMYHSWEFTRQVNLLGARGVRAAAPDLPRKVANCMHPAELGGAFTFVHDVLRRIRALAFPLGTKPTIPHVAELVAEHGIDTVVSSPAYGTDLIVREPGRHLRNLLYLGEPVGPARQELIKAVAPDVTIRSFAYSTTETGPIGYQCPHLEHATHHVHEDAVVVEIVDETTGEPVPEGSPGAVLVTPLSTTGMALFRYWVGDRGRLGPPGCACGSSARLLTLLGRTGQTLVVDTWKVSADQLMERLTGLGVTDPADCQFQVLWDFPHYQVRLLLSPRTPAGLTTAIVAESLHEAHHIHQVIAGPRCAGFTVERVGTEMFARTERDKVPVLYQRM
ncbi:phenylacetate--CoA ligase family protein [Actinocrispum wychmicini]|uniref:Phenylacetate-CoA ligase n=1 Tax=Actinocrispum wychmicini TaxID=1213861 RepID=A0A4R2JSZ3_9PSEU|nr:AMP-binding protein [Actinocrispum wychmicini]TCO62744.1 phenylacetate-CoA ligase [Actinocrispum wychmicini]